MSNIRHVLGISGGKDSAALAIYLNRKYPQLDIEYYFCDTGRELDETYLLVQKLETILNKKIRRLKAVVNTPAGSPFDHFLEMFGGYLPSTQSRWCTRKLKLEPFEKYVGDDPVVSYVGIRGDENREAYISRKPNIQSIFPFRRNLWSEDIIRLVLNNANIAQLRNIYGDFADPAKMEAIQQVVKKPVSPDFNQDQKLNALLDLGVQTFNKVVFAILKTSNYPLGQLEDYPLLDNEDVLVKEDIFRILEESGVGIPKYYHEIEFEINGKTGKYARTRSGCFFCFFQQKIEWIWLYEQHPELFQKALEYEKDGYTWMQSERLEELIQPERIKQIKEDHLKRLEKLRDKRTDKLIDILDDDSEEGCAVCFI